MIKKNFETNILEIYPYLEIGMQLYYLHYCKIVEFKHNHDKNKQKKNSESQKGSRKKVISKNTKSQSLEITNKVNILTKVLFNIHRRKSDSLELEPLEPQKFEKMIEETNPELKGFFPSMVNAIIPKERSAYNRQEVKKSIVALCYMISGLRNKFVNQLKTEMINENRRPDTVSTSTAKHFVTCVAKPIIECSFTPLVFNGISIHNLLNVEAQKICWYLINRYSGVFDLSYLQKHSIINKFDRIEMLTIHNYNDNITERKEEWSMKDLQLIGFKEQNLHSIFDYINALKIILSVHDKTQHLRESEYIEYRTTIDLLDNLIPAVLDIYAILFRSGLFEEYVEIIFRIWTFALRWKRKNYNKAPLVFLSDLFYWKDHNHPFYNILQNYLPGFNDYFVENTHSKIRANTSSNATTDNIIKQAYVIIQHLIFLSNKTSIFLLQYFHNLYNNLEKSVPKLNKKIKKQNPKIYILATLEEEVDLRRLPTGYSTSYPPKQGLCDQCKLPFINGYYTDCYNGKCTYCEEYYKRDIFENVNSFLKQIEKGANTLTQEDLDDERNDIEEEQEQTEEIEMQDISNRLEVEINQIENW
ncbi:hypothetical protein Glove_438g1 [Diversispora epigaea]|uniref:Uncharacterized protein n=1 Tax=Diversispora epigaea TaxID=1348612 RepID=A0A397GW10_9GLOM|nr:hypothetical protein Glove_438g1 [Diversispora epigaea]